MLSCVRTSRPTCRRLASVRFAQGPVSSQAHAVADQTSDVGRKRTDRYGARRAEKQIRDRIKSHALHDVSSKNYDRWNYMSEKRAGMARWDRFVRALLAKKSGRKDLKQAA